MYIFIIFINIFFISLLLIPFFYKIFPQNANNKLKSWLPRSRQRLYVKVGDPVSVSDLIEPHKLNMAKAEQLAKESGVYGSDAWTKFVADEENALHVAITSRIQLSLLKVHNFLIQLLW